MIRAIFKDKDEYSSLINYAVIGQALLENNVRDWSFYWDALDSFIAKEMNDNNRGLEDLMEFLHIREELYSPEEITSNL